MSTHEALTDIAFPNRYVRAGDIIEWTDAPNWKVRPLDPEACSKWEAETADPERLQDYRRRNSIPGWLPEGGW